MPIAVRPASSSTTAGLVTGARVPPETASTRLRSGTRSRKYIPRMRPPTLTIARYGLPLGRLDLVVPGHVERVPGVADVVDLHVEVERPRRQHVELRGRGHVGVDRVEIVARILPHGPVEAAPGDERLVRRIAEPGQQQVTLAERVGRAEEVAPLLGRQGEERGEQPVRERRQEGLAVLARRPRPASAGAP